MIEIDEITARAFYDLLMNIELNIEDDKVVLNTYFFDSSAVTVEQAKALNDWWDSVDLIFTPEVPGDPPH